MKQEVDYEDLTSWPLSHFNNDYLLKYINKINGYELPSFLTFFTNNYLKIGNVSRLRIKAHDSSTKCVAFSRDDRYFGSSGRDGNLNIYLTHRGDVIQNFRRPSKILCFAFSPKEDRIVMGQKNKILELINITMISPLNKHQEFSA